MNGLASATRSIPRRSGGRSQDRDQRAGGGAKQTIAQRRTLIAVDVGTVERDLEIGTIRSSVGVGVRVILPLGGNRLPLAIDFGFPLSKDSQDDTQVISFSFGGQF